jgi:predicted MFS family arabinose efflux permease
VGLSFLSTQVIAQAWGWRWAFFVTGATPIVTIGICALLTPAWPTPTAGGGWAMGRVLRNRPAMGYVLGYGVHCFELYGYRTWLVAFWSYVAARNGGSAILEPVMVSVLVTLLAVPASVLGNESALRVGRHRSIAWVQSCSALVAGSIGLCISLPPTVLLALVLAYAFTLPGDSGALTSGMTQSATTADKGATMAMHSMVGFGMAAAGGTLVGIALDAAGGPATDSGWTAAFLVMASGIALGPLALAWSRRTSAVN